MEKMEIITHSLLEKESITAFEDKIVIIYKNLIGEYYVEYKYSDLKSRITRGKSGDSEWTSVGYFLISLMFVSTFFLAVVFTSEFLSHPSYKLIPICLTVLSFAAFSLRLIKYEKIWIYDKDNRVVCTIKVTNSNREHSENIKNYIMNKVEKTNIKNAE